MPDPTKKIKTPYVDKLNPRYGVDAFAEAKRRQVRRWRSATGQGAPKADAMARAQSAWRRFVACIEALPPEQAAPLWQAAQTQAAEFLIPSGP